MSRESILKQYLEPLKKEYDFIILDCMPSLGMLTEILRNNDIKSVTIVRMEVPCCGGLQRAAENAIRNSGKFIPWQVVTISRDGSILD